MAESIRSAKTLKSCVTIWNEVVENPAPPRVCYMEEYEYIIEAKVGYSTETPEYFGYVIRNVKANNGITYIEIFRMTSLEAHLWEKDANAKEGKDCPRNFLNIFMQLANLMLSLNRTNLLTKIDTPYKKTA